MQFSPVAFHFLPLRPKYLPQHTVFKHTQLCRDQVSHPRRTRGMVFLLFVSIFTFVYHKKDGKRFWREWQKTFPEFNLLLISSVYSYRTVDCESSTLLVDSVHGFECEPICITMNCNYRSSTVLLQTVRRLGTNTWAQWKASVQRVISEGTSLLTAQCILKQTSPALISLRVKNLQRNGS